VPSRPIIRYWADPAQNRDVFFQIRESANSYYDKLAEILGRSYHLFDYVWRSPRTRNPSRSSARITDNHGPWLRRSISVTEDNFVRAKTVRPEGC
jgi:hypothetical protein